MVNLTLIIFCIISKDIYAAKIFFEIAKNQLEVS